MNGMEKVTSPLRVEGDLEDKVFDSSPLPSPLRVEGELKDKVFDYAIGFLILLFYCIIKDDQ
jgi:hypothetical protein